MTKKDKGSRRTGIPLFEGAVQLIKRLMPAVPAIPRTEPAQAQPSAATPSSGWSLELLHKLEWKRFEELAAEFYRLQGYTAKTIAPGPDGGIDIVIQAPNSKEPISLVQCRSPNTRQVGVKHIRELRGVLTRNQTQRGIFVTTATITEEAKSFAKDNGLTLINAVAFLKEIRKLAADKQQTLLEFALRGDYTTPTCPDCDIKMVVREPQNGKKSWGCPNHPKCRRTFEMRAN